MRREWLSPELELHKVESPESTCIPEYGVGHNLGRLVIGSTNTYSSFRSQLNQSCQETGPVRLLGHDNWQQSKNKTLKQARRQGHGLMAPGHRYFLPIFSKGKVRWRRLLTILRSRGIKIRTCLKFIQRLSAIEVMIRYRERGHLLFQPCQLFRSGADQGFSLTIQRRAYSLPDLRATEVITANLLCSGIKDEAEFLVI